MKEKLKPCPFCGESTHIWHAPEPFEPEYVVHCDKCMVERTGATQEEAIAAWNIRPIEDKLRAKLINVYLRVRKLRKSYPQWVRDWLSNPREDVAWTELNKNGEVVQHE